MNILRRLPLSRLLLLCGLAVAIGISATALALALDTGPVPPARPLAQAVHDALSPAAEQSVAGFSANVTLRNHLLEGASLATGGEPSSGGLLSSPLVTGASGRLWISASGHMRLELQAEQGDTQILYDGHTVSIYDAASNTVYRYTPRQAADWKDESRTGEEPSVAKIEEAIAHIRQHARLSEATPTDVGGQPAYTVRLSPSEGGSLLGGAELSFDADNGAPLRAAVYSSTSSEAVIELAASNVSFGAVPESVFQITPPANAKVEELVLKPAHDAAKKHSQGRHRTGEQPRVSTRGHGISAVAVLEAKTHGSGSSATLEDLPKVEVAGANASELRTELGTLLTFERAGIRYVLAGSVPPGSLEAIARGL